MGIVKYNYIIFIDGVPENMDYLSALRRFCKYTLGTIYL